MSKFSKYQNIEPEQLLKNLNMLNPPFNPYDVARALEIPIGEELDWVKLAYDGEIFFDENHDIRIWINQTNHLNRKKFTIAHEIGHFINDVLPNYESFEAIFDDKETLSFKRDGDRNFIEYRANDFAARLLMPKEYILIKGRQEIDSYSASNNGSKISKELLIKNLSNAFEVSEDAMKWRLINLNLINK